MLFSMMRDTRGFTIVEIVVVMVIMAVLMGFGFVLLSGAQIGARDAERKADIKAIANGLELRYKNGNSSVTAPSYVAPGSYPSIDEMNHILGSTVSGFTPSVITGGYTNDVFPGTKIENFSPPDVSGNYSGFTLICTGAADCATKTAENTASITSSITTSQYIYEPIASDGSICVSTSCVRYNLYWIGEGTGLTTLQTTRSRHQ